MTEKTVQSLHNTESPETGITENLGLEEVPQLQRTHWIDPAVIYAGCMICVPVIYVGAMLTNMYSFSMAVFAILMACAIVLVYDFINSSLGQEIGRPASAIARCSFGRTQSRILISGLLIYMCLGWYGLHVAVSAKAALMLFGFDYTQMSSQWPLLLAMLILGLFFATPAVIGYKWLSWIGRVGLPLILIVGSVGTVIAVNAYGGWSNVVSYVPAAPVALSVGITAMIGCCAGQFVMISDYTRYCRKIMPDALLVPLLGVIPAGIFLFMMGVIMSAGTSSADIVYIMGVELNLPFWAFVFLIFAQWTTEIVGAYSGGLSIVNMFNLKGGMRNRATLIGALIGTIAAMAGILDVMESFLYTCAVAYPVVGSIMAVDFYLLRNRKWEDIPGVNWIATVTFVISCATGLLIKVGYATLTTFVLAGVLYYTLTVLIGRYKPNAFTPEAIKNGSFKVSFSDSFLSLGLAGSLFAAVIPIIWPTTMGDIGAIIGTGLVGIGFYLKVRKAAVHTPIQDRNLSQQAD